MLSGRMRNFVIRCFCFLEPGVTHVRAACLKQWIMPGNSLGECRTEDLSRGDTLALPPALCSLLSAFCFLPSALSALSLSLSLSLNLSTSPSPSPSPSPSLSRLLSLSLSRRRVPGTGARFSFFFEKKTKTSPNFSPMWMYRIRVVLPLRSKFNNNWKIWGTKCYPKITKSYEK